MNNIIGIMKNVSIKRLYLGGLLVSVCAFIYCIGFFHIVLGIQEKYFNLAWFVFLINVFGMIPGGSYHIQCAYFGLLSRYENKGAFDEFLKFLKFQAKIVFGIMALANIAMAWIILTGFAVFPSRQAFFTPIFLLIFTPIAGRLPKGLYMIVRGGWLNLICFVYYLSLLINYTNMNL